MFDKKFIEEIFKPQEIYSRRIMRTFFEKIAHSSIMRLNETSMDKLYDLMTMAFKYQIQMCSQPDQIIIISLNHIDGIRKILPNDEFLGELLDSVHNMLVETYSNLPLWEKSLIRNFLLLFFQDARVRVSLLLREKKQMDDGRFLLFPSKDIELPYKGEQPGTIKYFTGGKITKTETFPLIRKQISYKKCETMGDLQLRTTADRGTTLGRNMYISPDSFEVKGGGSLMRVEVPPPGDELKLLSALIIRSNIGEERRGIELSLFNDELEEKQFIDATQNAHFEFKRIDAHKSRKTLNKALAELKIGENDETPKSETKEDVWDLLEESKLK